MAQEGSEGAQVGSKVGPEMRKVAKVKLLKNHLFLLCLGPSWAMKTQEDVKTAQVTCQMVKVTCQ